MRCVDCDYLLKNLTAVEGKHRCPECGRAFDPRDRSTWQPVSGERWIRQRIAIWLALILLLFAVCIGSVIEVGQRPGPLDWRLCWTFCLIRCVPVAALWLIVYAAGYFGLRPKGMQIHRHERTALSWMTWFTVAGLFGALVVFLAPHLRR